MDGRPWFFDVKTFKDVVNARGRKRLITIEPTQSVSEAVDLMKQYDIEHIPVIKQNELIGSISEGGFSGGSKQSRRSRPKRLKK
jgi:cystathionine beta-synthase